MPESSEYYFGLVVMKHQLLDRFNKILETCLLLKYVKIVSDE